MGSSSFLPIFYVLFLIPVVRCNIVSDTFSPLLPPYVGDICREVECGKGVCSHSINSTFLFKCECDPGWIRPLSKDGDTLTFLPCVIPNCTLDYTCYEASLPSPSKLDITNSSIFDPCFWSYCGGGKCNKKSSFKHTCECNSGYYNLLNITSFPCLNDYDMCKGHLRWRVGRTSKSCTTPSITPPAQKMPPLNPSSPPRPQLGVFCTRHLPPKKPRALGGDCSHLGLTISNTTKTSNSSHLPPAVGNSTVGQSTTNCNLNYVLTVLLWAACLLLGL